MNLRKTAMLCAHCTLKKSSLDEYWQMYWRFGIAEPPLLLAGGVSRNWNCSSSSIWAFRSMSDWVCWSSDSMFEPLPSASTCTSRFLQALSSEAADELPLAILAIISNALVMVPRLLPPLWLAVGELPSSLLLLW